MPAGRKTSTYDVDTGAENEHARWKFESQQRLLGEKLGGVIFVCNKNTYEECIVGQIFGLPASHWCYVENIVVGMPMFLYNYSTRQLHGIWESTTAGEWKLNPAGWSGDPESTRTMYPCQVGVKPYSLCPPLDAMEYRPILKAAYFTSSSDPRDRGKFSLELTKTESVGLCQAFDRKAKNGGSKSSQRPQPIPGASAAPAMQRPPAAAATSAAAPAQAPVDRPSATQTPSLKAEDFPALAASSSQPPAWGKKPHLPKVDEDGFQEVVGKGKGQRGQAAAAAAPAAQSAAPAAQSAAPAEAAASQPAKQPPPQIKTRPAANNSDTAKVPEAPSTPPLAHKDASTSLHGHGSATFASVPIPAASPPVSGSSAPDTTTATAAAHAAVAGLDVAAADAIHYCFSVMASRIERLEREKTLLAQRLQTSQANIAILQREQQRTRLEMAQLGLTAGLPISAEAPELQAMGNKAILLLGGHDGQQWTTMMHLFHPQLSEVQDYDQIPFSQGYGGCILLGRSIYIIGGGDGVNWNRTAYTFDLDAKEWFQVADMREERGSLGVAEVGGLIYAMGGGRGGPSQANLDTVEVFKPDLNVWSPGPKLHEQRFTTSAAAINGAIYVTGGFDGSAYLRTAERLDPRVGAWQPVPEMAPKRGSHMSAVLGDSLYVMGGWDSENYLDSMEIFDTRAGRWRSASPMMTSRAYGSTAVLDDQIYMIGGLSDMKHATNVERFNPVVEQWEQICMDTPISRAFMSAVIVDV